MNHLDHCSLEAQEIAPFLLPEEIIKLSWAIAFHDAIYNPSVGRGVNEAQSAQFAYNELNKLGYKEPFLTDIYNLVLMTDHNEETYSQCADINISNIADYLLDIDMSILGQNQFKYLAYVSQVEKEYLEHFPVEVYRKGRIHFLESLLVKDTIYKTLHFKDKYGFQACMNISHELRILKEEH